MTWLYQSASEAVYPVNQPPVSCFCLCAPTVPTLPEEGRQQASDHAAAKEAIQEPDHPGLQDPGPGTHQHGRGITT